MAATLTRERFKTDEWVFERKLDGIRLLAFKEGGEVRLMSRNQLLRNASYPSVVAAVEALPVQNVILDGEALGAWEQSVSDGYWVFDVLWLEDSDLTVLPLAARREVLSGLPLVPPLWLVERLDDAEPWQRA